MLISPPFLPARQNNETDATWLARAMPEVSSEGMYPVGNNCCWHGGIHLEAPIENGHHLAVRAIADGTVLVAQPTPAIARSDDANDPLNYNNGWTSNSVVVIQHDTEIGANAQGVATTVRFYSVYMHLSSIAATVRVGRPIYRKDEIGVAGYISGQPDRIHFEIACDEANLRKLIGRIAGDLPITQDGRTDAVLGELYFTLPSGTPVYAHKPLDNTPVAASYQAPRSRANAPLSPVQPITLLGPTAVDCIVGLRYAMGDGTANTRGNLTITTYRYDASEVGVMPALQDYEYNLYSRAKEISNTYPANNRPAPSAVYELLRFGRVINTAHETLTPADIPLWHEIILPTASGTGTQRGWVNLNNQAAGQEVRKFSDADFPHWRSWQIFNDDLSAADSRCDSDGIKTLLDIDGNHHVTPAERVERMASDAIKIKMRKAICAMPSEWDATSLDTRWRWLKEKTEENPEPFGDEDFIRLKAAYEKYCFPGKGLFSATYRFHPLAFIETFRKCGWLSRVELAQLIPRTSLANFAGTWDAAARRIDRVGHINLNRTFQKYGFINPHRQTAFLAQAYIETGCFSLLAEGGAGNFNPRQPMTQYYAAFYGRGLMQLTWACTYANYGNFRAFRNHQGPYADNRITGTSLHDWDGPTRDQHNNLIRDQRQWSPRFDPDIVASDLYNACDSGAFFWVQKHFTGTSNIHRMIDEGLNTTQTGRISILVNGGGNGYNERLQYAAFIDRFRGDGTESAQTGTVTAIRQSISHGRWTAGAAINLAINYTPQRPA